MQLDTSRFGRLGIDARELLFFPEGLIGFEQLHAWALLREGSLSWLQSLEDLQTSLPVVSPFSYAPDYRVCLSPTDLPIDVESSEQAVVLCVVGQQDGQWTLNLRAPIVVRPELRLGLQIIAGGEHPLQYVLPRTRVSARKSA